MPRCCSVALLALLAGCACDLDGWAHDRAGAGAVDCGRSSVGELEDPFHQCAVDAFRDGEAFVVLFERLGRDSQRVDAWAGDADGNVWWATYDSDPFGRGDRYSTIDERGCEEARVGTTRPPGASIGPGQEVLGCTVAYYERVCD